MADAEVAARNEGHASLTATCSILHLWAIEPRENVAEGVLCNRNQFQANSVEPIQRGGDIQHLVAQRSVRSKRRGDSIGLPLHFAHQRKKTLPELKVIKRQGHPSSSAPARAAVKGGGRLRVAYHSYGPSQNLRGWLPIKSQLPRKP